MSFVIEDLVLLGIGGHATSFCLYGVFVAYAGWLGINGEVTDLRDPSMPSPAAIRLAQKTKVSSTSPDVRSRKEKFKMNVQLKDKSKVRS